MPTLVNGSWERIVPWKNHSIFEAWKDILMIYSVKCCDLGYFQIYEKPLQYHTCTTILQNCSRLTEMGMSTTLHTPYDPIIGFICNGGADHTNQFKQTSVRISDWNNVKSGGLSSIPQYNPQQQFQHGWNRTETLVWSGHEAGGGREKLKCTKTRAATLAFKAWHKT